MARDIALIEPNPDDLGGWVTYLLERLEEEALRRRKSEDFHHMISSLMDYLHGHNNKI